MTSQMPPRRRTWAWWRETIIELTTMSLSAVRPIVMMSRFSGVSVQRSSWCTQRRGPSGVGGPPGPGGP
jgi:hypothetical protein